MNEDPRLITSTQFVVASWDVDACNRLTTAAMGRYMQEAAEANAVGLGAGFGQLMAEGQTWVLSALLLQSSRSASFTDEISVETWPRQLDGLRALRDYRFHDRRGREFAVASTTWFCLDLKSRRPVRPDRWQTMDWAADRRATPRNAARLPGASAPAEVEVSVPVRWSDLDLNGHITNTRYQDLLLESYPADWLREHTVSEIELNFVAEGAYPETLICRRSKDATAVGTWQHSLVRHSDDREVARGRVVWR